VQKYGHTDHVQNGDKNCPNLTKTKLKITRVWMEKKSKVGKIEV